MPTRADLERTGRWLEVSDEEWAQQHASVKAVVDRCLANDAWATKIHKNVAVLLTASVSSRPYLKGSVESFRRLGYWTVLVYDNFVDPTWGGVDYNGWMPPKDVMDLLDSFLIATPYQTWGGVSYPYIFQLRIAAGLFQGFDYVLCANGDCILEKPEGFPQLLELMGDADLMSTGPVNEKEVGTAAFLVRPAAFVRLAKHLNDHVVPYEAYERSTQEYGNTEGRLAAAVRELGIKQAIVPNQPESDQHHTPQGTWYDLVGFRHIHGEHNYAYRYKAIPPHPRYFDPRFMSEADYRGIVAYHEQGDTAALKDWWCKT